jgi:hypothetical protein
MRSIINAFKRHPLAGLLIIAAIVRLLYVAVFADYWRFYDTIHYDTAGRYLAQGQGFGPSLHYGFRYSAYCLEPIYPLFIGALYFLFGPSALSVRIAQIVLSLLQTYFLFDITRRFFSKRAAFMAAAFSAVYPFYIMITGLVYPTQLFAFLLLALVWSLVRYKANGRTGYLILSSISFGLAVQTGPAIMPAAPFLLWWLWYYRPRQQQPLFAFIGIFIITMLPWTLRNYFTFHTFAPGRACLEEKRFINNFYYELVNRRAFAQEHFHGQKVAIHFRQAADTLWIDGYVDSLRIVSMRPLDQKISIAAPKYLGILFEGQIPNRVERVKAFAVDSSTPTSPALLFDSADLHAEEHTPAVAIDKAAVVLEQALKNKWSNKLVWTDSLRANYFEMQLADSIKPDELRRMALLLYLDKPKVSANGYMFWLQPCLEFDLWQVKDGKPHQAVTMEKIYWQREKLAIPTVMWREPKAYFLDHYIPEFLNFWSPIVKRIETIASRPSPLMQAVSLVFFLPVLLLFIAALWRFRKHTDIMTITLLPVLTIAFSYALFSTEVRYRIPIDGFLILWAAAGLDSLLPSSHSTHQEEIKSSREHGAHG